MTPQECRRQKWPHNHRCRYTHGFYCEDCEVFYDKDSVDYLRYEFPSTVAMSLHNLRADCVRQNVKPPRRLTELMSKVDTVPKIKSASLRTLILNKALVFLGSAGIADPESNTTMTLR